MVYEAALLFGVAFAAGALLVLVTGWHVEPEGPRRWTLQAWIFFVVGAYFVSCWVRTGQTLALKTWRLRVADDRGNRLRPVTAIGRYVLSWTLVLPGLALALAFGHGVAAELLWFAGGFAAMFALAFADPQRRFLHDRLLRTRIVEVPRDAADQRPPAAVR